MKRIVVMILLALTLGLNLANFSGSDQFEANAQKRPNPYSPTEFGGAGG